MQITYELNEQDFLDSFATHRKNKTLRKWFIRCIAAFMLLVAGFLAYELIVAPTRQNAESTAPYFILLILWFAFVFFVQRWNVRRQFSKQPAAKGPRIATFDDSGIHTRWDGGSSDAEWKNYIKAIEGKNVFLLYLSPAYFGMIPKRALSPEQLNELRELLKQKIPPR